MLRPSPERPLVSPADLAQCRQMIRDGSKTFYTASLLLPQRVCDASRALYGFCRVADDLVDQSTDSRAVVPTPRKLALLAQAVTASLQSAPASAAPAIASAQFLIDAVASAGQPIHPPRTLDERAQWLTDLFTRLEKQRP